MKVDLGFWNQQGEYIEDIQEVSEMETKNFDEFFDELNDMANFKGFGEKPETEEIIIDGVNVEDCSYYNKDNYPYCCEVWDNECEAQNCYYKQLQRLQQENAELIAENERLNRCMMEALHHEGEKIRETIKYKQTLQEIKAIAEKSYHTSLIEKDCVACDDYLAQILQKITKAEEE